VIAFSKTYEEKQICIREFIIRAEMIARSRGNINRMTSQCNGKWRRTSEQLGQRVLITLLGRSHKVEEDFC
jgi:hypothetical protein